MAAEDWIDDLEWDDLLERDGIYAPRRTRRSWWTCRDGSRIRPMDMPNSHLLNVIAFLGRQTDLSDDGRNWLKVMKRERDARRA